MRQNARLSGASPGRRRAAPVYDSFYQRLAGLVEAGAVALLREGRMGLERECLRVSPSGTISQSPHPAVLGAALTHPSITTDYSEALLELITAPRHRPGEVLDELGAILRFVYASIGEELLWAASMPCVVDGEASIPIARYGTSNVGHMKHVYRRGLAYRYGKTMQVIAGIHFNYSFADAFWPAFADLAGDRRAGRELIDEAYFSLTRNLLRVGWLVPFLFGASPAVCNSFFSGRQRRLSTYNASTRYEPFATSLRMSDIGYQNDQGGKCGVEVDYNSLAGYVASLRAAITRPCPPYQEIGVEVDGEYRQLNANRLQIENEYYSSVRVKQVARRLEKPTAALEQRGVQYLELRSLDVSPFHPLGVDETQLHFLQTLLAFCLLQESPPMDSAERQAISANMQRTALGGRDPELKLVRDGREIGLRQWAGEVLECVAALAASLDADTGGSHFAAAALAQQAKVVDADATPSAAVLHDMREHDEGFYHCAMRWSRAHSETMRARPPSPAERAKFERLARESLAEQAALEAADTVDFGTFLAGYFSRA